MNVEVQDKAKRWPVAIGAVGIGGAIGAVICRLAVSSEGFSVGSATALVLSVAAITIVSAAPLFVAAMVNWSRQSAFLLVVPLAWLLSAKAWFLLIDHAFLKVLQHTTANTPHNYREALYILLTEDGAGMAVYGLALVAMIYVTTSMQMSRALQIAAQAITLVAALLFAFSCIEAIGIA